MRSLLAVFLLSMGLVAADRAYANVTISAVESGGAVIFTFSGSVDLTSLDGPDPSPSASVFSSGDQVIVTRSNLHLKYIFGHLYLLL